MNEKIDLMHGITLDEGASCACGGGECGCGGHHHEHGSHRHGSEGGDEREHGSSAAVVTTTFGVTGMTCHHCVMSVTEEVSEIPGVTDVAVDLKPGEVSQVTVKSTSELTRDALAGAVREAGYELA